MKNATSHKKKIRSLLRGLAPWRLAPWKFEGDRLELLVNAVFQEDTSAKQAEKALEAIRDEFVDFNELRVCLAREVAECVGKNYPGVREKAEMIRAVLNSVFDRFNRLSIDDLAEVPKKELQRRLEELGLSPFAAACVGLLGFDGASVPVDGALAGSLEMNGCVEAGSSRAEVQELVQKVVAPKDVRAAHLFFRDYVERNAKDLARKRQAEAEAKAKAEAEARAKAEAEAKAKAEAEAKIKAQAEAKAKAKAEAEAKKAAAKAAKAKAAKPARKKPSAARKKPAKK